MVHACHDIVHRVYQGVLYFQNVTHFHSTCTNAISFAPIRQVQPSHRVYQGILYFQNVTHFHGTCTNVISFAPIRQVEPYLPLFNENHKCTIGLGADLMY